MSHGLPVHATGLMMMLSVYKRKLEIPKKFQKNSRNSVKKTKKSPGLSESMTKNSTSSSTARISMITNEYFVVLFLPYLSVRHVWRWWGMDKTRGLNVVSRNSAFPMIRLLVLASDCSIILYRYILPTC